MESLSVPDLWQQRSSHDGQDALPFELCVIVVLPKI